MEKIAASVRRARGLRECMRGLRPLAEPPPSPVGLNPVPRRWGCRRWYVDTMVGLISFAGEFVSDAIWHRVVHIVTNNEDLQEYAAGRVWEHFRRGSKHEPMTNVRRENIRTALSPVFSPLSSMKCSFPLQLSGYILGEFGHHLQVAPLEIFQRLHDKFVRSSNDTKTLLLSAYA